MLNTQNQTRNTHIKALLLLPMMVMLVSFSSFGQSNGKMKQLNMKETEKLMYKLKQLGKLSNGERPAINISPEIAGKAPMHILIHQKKKYWVKGVLLNRIAKDAIAEVYVLKGAKAKSAYGANAKNGVVTVLLKE